MAGVTPTWRGRMMMTGHLRIAFAGLAGAKGGMCSCPGMGMCPGAPVAGPRDDRKM